MLSADSGLATVGGAAVYGVVRAAQVGSDTCWLLSAASTAASTLLNPCLHNACTLLSLLLELAVPGMPVGLCRCHSCSSCWEWRRHVAGSHTHRASLGQTEASPAHVLSLRTHHNLPHDSALPTLPSCHPGRRSLRISRRRSMRCGYMPWSPATEVSSRVPS